MNTVATALHTFLGVALASAFLIMGITHDAPVLWDHSDTAEIAQAQRDREAQPVNVPKWNASDAATGCTKNPTDAAPSNVLVVTQGNDREIISFDEAWNITHNDNKADDVWVIGFCS